MTPHNETAAVTGSIVAAAGPVSKALRPSEYRQPSFSATNFAAALVAQRYRVTPTRARLLVELIGLARKA